MEQKTRKKKIRGRLLISILSLAVAGLTVAALMLPAITMEYETVTEETEACKEYTEYIESVETSEVTEAADIEDAAAEAQTADEDLTDGAALVDERAATRSASVWTANSAAITAAVTMEGSALNGGEFTFELLDASTNEVLQTAQNRADGSVVFEPISYSKSVSGIFTYKVREAFGTDLSVSYDDSVYIISVGVENGNATVLNEAKTYYGVKSTSPYGWNMSTTLGGADYFVYCIDAAKPSPGTVAIDDPYWIAEYDPDNNMLKSAVRHTAVTTSTGIYVPPYNGWLDTPSLKENLKRVLYTVNYGSLTYLDGTQKAQLVWWAVSGDTYLSYSNSYSKYVNYMNICLNTEVPSGYDLVLFHSSDGLSQPFVALQKSDTAATFGTKKITFANQRNDLPETDKDTTAETPNGTAENPTVTLTARKTLDGRTPEDMRFRFRLLDADGNVLQTKENAADGTVTFDPIRYTEAGTYHYTVNEVNDGQSGIRYDTKSVSVSVTVSSSSTEIDGETLDGGYMKESNTNSYFYMTDPNTGKTYKAFCLHRFKTQPAGQTFLASVDVSDAVIQANMTTPSAENLLKVKKVLYYFNLHPDAYNDFFKQLIFWQATGTDLGTQQGVVLADALNTICDEITSIPSNFHTVYFDSGDSSYQCLLLSYLTPDPVVTLGASGDLTEILFENAGTVIVIEYTAVLNSDAEIAGTANNNDTWVTFGDGLTSTHSSTQTYTYRFDLIKTDENGNILQGAKFYLYDAAENGNVIPLVAVSEDADNGVFVYRVAAAEDAVSGNGAEIQAGFATVIGLDKEVYYLEETQQPTGYNILSEREAVDLTNGNVSAVTTDLFADGNTNVIGQNASDVGGLQIINRAGTVLPATGGIGTTMFFALGGLLVAAAGILLITVKRMRKEDK